MFSLKSLNLHENLAILKYVLCLILIHIVWIISVYIKGNLLLTNQFAEFHLAIFWVHEESTLLSLTCMMSHANYSDFYSCMLTRSSLSSENESMIIPNTMFRPMVVISMKKDKSSNSLHPAMSKIVRWSLPSPLLSSGIICGTQN